MPHPLDNPYVYPAKVASSLLVRAIPSVLRVVQDTFHPFLLALHLVLLVQPVNTPIFNVLVVALSVIKANLPPSLPLWAVVNVLLVRMLPSQVLAIVPWLIWDGMSPGLMPIKNYNVNRELIQMSAVPLYVPRVNLVFMLVPSKPLDVSHVPKVIIVMYPGPKNAFNAQQVKLEPVQD